MPCSPFINCSNNVTSLTDLLIRAMGEVSVGSYAISAIETDDTFENCEIGCDEVQSTETFLRLLLKNNSGVPALGVLTLSGTPQAYADCTQYSLLNLINALITKVGDCYYLKIMAVDNFSYLDCQEHQQPLETIFRRSIVKNSEGCLAVAVYFNETGTPVSCDNQIPAPFTILKGAFGKQTTTGIYALRMIGSGTPEPGCPVMCGSDLNLLGFDGGQGDGWYVNGEAQQLLHIVNDEVVETAPCTSGFADLYVVVDPQDNPNLRGGPYLFSSGSWTPILGANAVVEDNTAAVTLVDDGYFNPETTATRIEIRLTPDGVWNEIESVAFNGDSTPVSLTQSVQIRIKVTDANSCVFYGFGSNGITLCYEYKPEEFQYALPSADLGGSGWEIFPTAKIELLNAIIGSVDIEGSTDPEATWFTIAADVDPILFDGTNGFQTNQISLVTRLKITDTLGCVYYSDVNTQTL